MTSFALASLTEIYTDSEGEEGSHHVIINNASRETSSSEKSPFEPVKTSSNSVSNLVSYHDENALSDDEHSAFVSKSREESPPVAEVDIEIPPEPAGRCSNELQEKIARLHEEMISKGLDMNQMIQKRKDFRNPSIYEKLIQFCSINEFGTNYSPEVYDPLKWGKSSFYDELAKSQKAEMDAKEKERREKTKVEFLMGTAKKTNAGGTTSASDEDTKRRKSKWDQVGSGSQTVVKPPGLLPLTATATGTKSTIISAFGSLPKKARI